MPIAFVEPTPSASSTTEAASKHHGVAFAVDPPSEERSQEEKLERMMQVHQTLVDAVQDRNKLGIVPFAKDCQSRLEELGGWKSHGIEFAKETGDDSTTVVDQFLLPNSKSQFPVQVLDGVLSTDLCRSFIDVHEKVGFARPPSLLTTLVDQLNGQDDEFLKKYAYEQAKNTSELVQIESKEFADYLWQRLEQYFPHQQAYVGQFTSGAYEKCGIIPVFRFMRYQKDQGFKPHKDPQRIDTHNPLSNNGGGNEESEPGIYQSLFTIALYLNDPVTDYQGGKLNFVKLSVDPSNGEKSYESQATVEPAVGRCVLFSHDELHEGGGVQSGTKYMCQCDVLYKRVGNLPGTGAL